MNSSVDIKFEWNIGSDVPETLLQECSDLFGQHYGTWSVTAGNRAGKSIHQSPTRIRELLQSKNARLATARKGEKLVAYAAAVQPNLLGVGTISWVTQLVVHSDFRQQHIAKKLLHSIWGVSDHFAWGLVTANPYAVRALEKATRRRVIPRRVAIDVNSILRAGVDIPYIPTTIDVICEDGISRINTKFLVDHSSVPMMLEQVNISAPWMLGQLLDGWEWFAFTFRDQHQIPMSAKEVEEMLRVADVSVSDAYGRMTMDENHAWHKYSLHEADFVWTRCNLKVGDRVLDLGCGDGRHLFALAQKGISGTGIDNVERRIHKSNKVALEQNLPIHFLAENARDVDLGETFDCVLCLYDVIGSYADNSDNIRIVNTVSKHVKKGGTALISVMNFELTRSIVTKKFSIKKEYDLLLDLQSSDIMQMTGNVFNPDYFMIDPEEQVVYRKERFTLGSGLPAEILVRDRRFFKEEIEGMCRASGLEIEWSGFVSAGKWERSLEATAPGAKEILVLCRKL